MIIEDLFAKYEILLASKLIKAKNLIKIKRRMSEYVFWREEIPIYRKGRLDLQDHKFSLSQSRLQKGGKIEGERSNVSMGESY